jgi:sugar O-acyltransferase (sialic acid O-acetyltransferase NeuD family)
VNPINNDYSVMARLVIWGAAGHACVVADAVRETGRFEIVGFLDDFNPERAGEPFCGARVLGGQERVPELRAGGTQQFIFGFGDCRARLQLADGPTAAGLEAAVVVHPRAVVSTAVVLGPGTFVAAGAVINSGATVGRHVIINTAASVDHHCEIADGAHVCPGVRLAGNVSIGRGSWVGIGATVIEKIRIGPGAVIGAGAVVIRDVPAGVLAVGVPARVVRRLDEGR